MNSIWLVELYYEDLTLRRGFETWRDADLFLRQHLTPKNTLLRWNIENIAFTAA